LPNLETPELFGLNANANISSNLHESTMILNSILSISPKSAVGGGEDENKATVSMAEEFLKQLPKPFDIEMVNLNES